MKKLKCAVIGVGYLGNFHAQKYHQLPNTELVGVCDDDVARSDEIAASLGCQAFYDHKELLKQEIDAVSIAVPTKLHYQVAKDCLSSGIHVLLEKPITTTVAEAEELIDIAKKQGVILQIGHLERFNSVLTELDGVLIEPRFIESHRLSPFNPRGTDVNVVLDLMIHDIDIIQSIVKSPILHLDALGVPILCDKMDIANARITFENGCVANVTASRASLKSERKMRFFQLDAYLVVDFQNKRVYTHRRGDSEMFPGIPDIESEIMDLDSGDSLLLQIKSFSHAITENKAPVVSGEDGKRALETAILITEKVYSTLSKHISPESLKDRF